MTGLPAACSWALKPARGFAVPFQAISYTYMPLCVVRAEAGDTRHSKPNHRLPCPYHVPWSAGCATRPYPPSSTEEGRSSVTTCMHAISLRCILERWTTKGSPWVTSGHLWHPTFP